MDKYGNPTCSIRFKTGEFVSDISSRVAGRIVLLENYDAENPEIGPGKIKNLSQYLSHRSKPARDLPS